MHLFRPPHGGAASSRAALLLFALWLSISAGAGAALAGARVTLGSLDTGLERVGVADADGAFTFSVARGGRYRLTAAATGFATAEQTLEAPGGEDVVFALEPAGLAEGVTVFSGSRQEELRESLDTKVEVVGRLRIRDTGFESVGEVLREVPGVLTRRGTEGPGAAGEQIQGIDSRQVLVLFDGQPAVGARGIKRGAINLDRQSIGPLERIEVVKGASSALYGSDAIGGVINQIARDPSAQTQFDLTASGGSQGRADYRGEAGLARDRVVAFLSAGSHKQNPFDLTPTTFDTTGAGFHRDDGFARLKYRLTPGLSLGAWARGYWASDRGRAVGEEGNQESSTDEDSQTYNLQADWQAGERTAIQARGYLARYDEITDATLYPAAGPPRPIAPGNLFERYAKADGSLLHVFGERQVLQAGREWARVEYRGFNQLADDRGRRAETASLWGQDKISFAGRATFTGGLRYDHHSIFGDAVSPKAGVNFRVTDEFRARFSYGRGFRAPDLGQLYYRFLNPTNFYQVASGSTRSGR